jgi:hypothetical protein
MRKKYEQFFQVTQLNQDSFGIYSWELYTKLKIKDLFRNWLKREVLSESEGHEGTLGGIILSFRAAVEICKKYATGEELIPILEELSSDYGKILPNPRRKEFPLFHRSFIDGIYNLYSIKGHLSHPALAIFYTTYVYPVLGAAYQYILDNNSKRGTDKLNTTRVIENHLYLSDWGVSTILHRVELLETLMKASRYNLELFKELLNNVKSS